MIITSILTLIGLFGTLAIVAYLRQVEDAIEEVQAQLEIPVCPVCHLSHPPQQNERLHTSKVRRLSYYYKHRKLTAKDMDGVQPKLSA
ncbi:hypothetical protein K3G39_01715 [Pontibacter sp. HSC-14F20]|uniref:hypothetical protein n=1 Tax=Pontibacter sp. HSC-14F20 TaxID=2864136 RepID=UPI001C738191|nr:hypothetical protein [Pontibacter sp. HSC-14F20]MBX0331948.1 hypothetical protein [Pontibacter sp. HSC-14F20]